MRIGTLSSRTGVSVRSLRYYEEQRLLYSVRTASGQREYADAAVDRVRLIQQLFAAGLASRSIVDILPCMDTGALTVEQVDRLGDEHERISARIAELESARARLGLLLASAAATGEDCVTVDTTATSRSRILQLAS